MIPGVFLKAIRASRAPGRVLLTSFQGSLDDPAINQLSQCCNARLFIIQDRLLETPANPLVTVVQGCFPEDVEGSHGQFSLILSPTPPDATGHGETALQFSKRLQACLAYLASGGYLALCGLAQVMQACLPAWAGRLSQALDNLTLSRLPDGDIFLLGARIGPRSPHQAERGNSILAALRSGTFPTLDLPTIQLAEPPRSASSPFFRSQQVSIKALAAKAASLPWDTSRLTGDLLGSLRPAVFPAMALRARLYGALVASGVLGSLRLVSPQSGHSCLLHGETRRCLSEASQQSWAEEMHTHLQRSAGFDPQINVLDMTSAQLRSYSPTSPGEMHQFLEEWSTPLAAELQRAFPTAYDPLTHPYPEVLQACLVAVIDRPFSGNHHLRGTLSPAQKHVLAALLIKCLGRRALLPGAPQYQFLSKRGNHSVVLAGDPGSGKTYISIRYLEGLTREYAARHGCSLQKGGWPLSLVVTPPGNLPNYLRSFRTASPLFSVRVVETIADLAAALKEAPVSPVPIVLLIARTRLRQSQAILPVYQTTAPAQPSSDGRLLPTIRCPNCASPILLPRAASSPEEVPHLIAETLLRGEYLRGAACSLCAQPLWQEAHAGSLYSLAKALKVLCRKVPIDLLGLVLDEVHEDGAASSKQGQAMAWLADLFPRVLALSATFYGGTASANFYLFYRLFPWFRRDWQLGEPAAFINRYGSWRQERHSRGWSARQELPGVSTELIANYLINDLVYLSLDEAGFEMVERRDIPLQVSPDPQEASALEQLHAALRADLTRDKAASQRTVHVQGRQLARLQVFPNGMHLAEFAALSPAYAQAPAGLDRTWRSSKEKALLALLQREAREQRPCLLYVQHSGRYAIDERLEGILQGDGLRVLNAAGIPGQQLEARINLAATTGTQVVIVNPRRTAGGLNLVGTPTIIFYEPLWSVRTTLQAAARSHRPGQQNPVRVYYMVLRGSVEEVILARVAERMAAIFLASGGDHAGMAAVLEASGHQCSLTELLIRFISDQVPYDLGSVFAELNQARQAFTGDSQPHLPSQQERADPMAQRDRTVLPAVQMPLF